MASSPRIEAAGGVLWRPAADGGGAEVCIVHRPKYDDYSVPKGKLARGEHVLLAAAREVTEETGCTPIMGPPLGEIRYLKDGLPKRVRYWGMRAAGGEFHVNDEVDEVLWVSPAMALTLLTPDRDQSVLEAFAADTTPTVALVLLRHASAGDPNAWNGDDRDRPLDDVGRDQAAVMAEILDLYAISAVVSADVLRCVTTVKPFADKVGLTVDEEPLLSESGFAQSPDITMQRVAELAASGQATVACSQGTVIPAVVTELCAAYGFPPPKDAGLRKGEGWIAHLAVGEHRLTALERISPYS
ncbi:MAG: 8-oxo-(d)GTP phosphatase [Frankiaceae bacterium]|nr:8-oxo-(d)GTP phosphatase [Frankiaceae bacterium]